ncbi:MAG: hypothetical protein HeimC3_28820 [Candidatus Heimdallarchaeota archaeon LC_3]|nr:MAG: hypothetical protein HeimC3_28820 [Candidatus Heimdallarchaeota archaeon LC_3]
MGVCLLSRMSGVQIPPEPLIKFKWFRSPVWIGQQPPKIKFNSEYYIRDSCRSGVQINNKKLYCSEIPLGADPIIKIRNI